MVGLVYNLLKKLAGAHKLVMLAVVFNQFGFAKEFIAGDRKGIILPVPFSHINIYSGSKY
jgi:hypothetical protein